MISQDTNDAAYAENREINYVLSSHSLELQFMAAYTVAVIGAMQKSKVIVRYSIDADNSEVDNSRFYTERHERHAT